MLDKSKTVIALGYFDSVHTGHRKVILEALKLAKSQNATLTVFSFNGELKGRFSDSRGYVYSPRERKQIFDSLGVDQVFFAPVTKSYLDKSKLAFLSDINSRLDICAYVCGSDYTFGKNASGNISFLKEYAKKLGQQVVCIELKAIGGEKVSTTKIKTLLGEGNIREANELLGSKYFITSTVIRGRGMGKKLQFPTANLVIDSNKCQLKEGVYSGEAIVDGTKYKAVINYGNCPTFNENKKILEAHILGLDCDVYGKEITVFFTRFLRNVVKFDSAEDLQNQIRKDIRESEKDG